MKRTLTVVIAAAIFFAACSSDSRVEEPAEPVATTTTQAQLRTITGTVTTLRSGDFHLIIDQGDLPFTVRNGEPCGYGDIRDSNQGAQIVVESSTGEIIGAERFDNGTLIGSRNDGYDITQFNWNMNATRAWFDCILPVSIPLSGESPFYKITIGGLDEFTYPHDELETADWILDLPLG